MNRARVGWNVADKMMRGAPLTQVATVVATLLFIKVVDSNAGLPLLLRRVERRSRRNQELIVPAEATLTCPDTSRNANFTSFTSPSLANHHHHHHHHDHHHHYHDNDPLQHVAALKQKIKALTEFAAKARFTKEGKAAHDVKIAALRLQVGSALDAAAAENKKRNHGGDLDWGGGRRGDGGWPKLPLPQDQLAKARRLVHAGINHAAGARTGAGDAHVAAAAGGGGGGGGGGEYLMPSERQGRRRQQQQQQQQPGGQAADRVLTTTWPPVEECEIKHYIEDKLGKVAVVNVKRRNRWGLNGTTAALVVRNRTGVWLIEQGSEGPPEGTGCGRNVYKGYRGFEDPRMIVWNGEHVVLVNGCYKDGRHMFLYRVTAGSMVRLYIQPHETGSSSRGGGDSTANGGGAGAGASSEVVEKNWTPYVTSSRRLRFVYSFGPKKALAVLELVSIISGACMLVHGTLAYDKTNPALGSTPLVPWQLPWYAGVAHTRGRVGDFRQLPPEILSGSSSPALSTATAAAGTPGKQQYRRRYRAVLMLYNAETFDVRFGSPLSFERPSNPLAEPWARDGQYDSDSVTGIRKTKQKTHTKNPHRYL